MPSTIREAVKRVRGRIPQALIHVREGELPKVVVSSSWSWAAKICLIHLVPITSSTTILFVNLHGRYIGIDFPGALTADTIVLMLFQVGAKVQEILIVASLGLIVLHAVRFELLYGAGLPLGLIGSGLAFSNFAFFASTGFWVGLKGMISAGAGRRQFGFIALVVLSGLTSLLAGPASAVLLVPKAQHYPAGGTDFFLNGSQTAFWPHDLSDDVAELQEYCNAENSATLGICPAGGFLSLWQRWATMNHTQSITRNIPSYAKDLTGSHFYWPIESPGSLIPPLYALGNPHPDNDTLQPYSWLVQTHAASAVMLQRIASDWWQGLPSSLSINPSLIDDRDIEASIPSVISAVRCADPQTLTASDKRVLFPTIERRWEWLSMEYTDVETLNTTAVDHLRFHWVHLPNEFGPTSIGAVFETPWATGNSSRVVVGCSAQTGWVPTNVFTDSYTFWSGWYPWNIAFGARAPAWTATAAGQSSSPTNGRIALGDSWLKLLTPLAPTIPTQNTTWQASTIESILAGAGLEDFTKLRNKTSLTGDLFTSALAANSSATRLLEVIISSVLADGLSRSGSHRVFNTTGPSSEWSLAMYDPLPDFDKRIQKGQMAFSHPNIPAEDLTTLHTTMMISGFAYEMTLAGYLSMAVLLTHIAMALAHIGWVLYYRQISQSWDSISELMALSQNSEPALNALKNTGAGIRCSKTFATMAKIRVRPQPKRPDLEHVELVFEDGAEADADGDVDEEAAAAGSVASDSESYAAASIKSRASHELRTSMAQKGHGSWTFPLSQSEAYRQRDIGLEDRSGVRARLITDPTSAGQEEEHFVRVNQLYS